LRDLAGGREEKLTAPIIDGHERVKETFKVTDYPEVTAKIVICRAKKRFDKEADRFRLHGMLVKSRHAIHDATLFDPGLESDPHAMWFYGRLVCSHIDDLWNSFDDRIELQKVPDRYNPMPVLDPSRKSGLTRAHPFVKALYGDALSRLRPLVEEERRRAEHDRKSIESNQTRKRLDALEKAVTRFLQDFEEEEEPSRDPDTERAGTKFLEHGFSLNPPFIQMVVGHSSKFWLNVLQGAFPVLRGQLNDGIGIVPYIPQSGGTSAYLLA
jgi:hypothetical protein